MKKVVVLENLRLDYGSEYIGFLTVKQAHK